jgi:crotonobetainyl-CoA:carnitine CoA-transferase CaiB-like acyl-CoA transferase
MVKDKGSTAQLPLEGTIVLDASRMLPGAVLARTLVDLGARVIKVEDPRTGDTMRHTPPLIGDTGAGFCALLRGCESVALDLRSERGAAAFRRLARHADVVAESFRPDTLDAWGLGIPRLHAINPRLVICSLSGFGSTTERGRQAAHDLNFVALAGVTDLLGGGVPRIQLADVGAALLAATAIVAALLRRERTGRGAHVEQPLAAAPLPFLVWAWADAAAGGSGVGETILAGRCPAYRTYRCGDGKEVAVGAIEPKFWSDIARILGLSHHAGVGLDIGPAGQAAAAEVGAAFQAQPRARWLELMAPLGLPVTPVNDLEAARRDPAYAAAGWMEDLPIPGGGAAVPGPFIPSLGRTPLRPAPRLGEHTAGVLAEFGVE